MELRRLWSEFGVTFSPEALQSLQGRSEIELQECIDCGFRFFDLLLAGNGAFYADLQRGIGAYYTEVRPEFVWTLKHAAKHGLSKVMDVGCGAGAFLSLARQKGLHAEGMEMNLNAVAASRGKGHEVFAGSIEEFRQKNPDKRFDLVTAFQVLEHVSDPIGFLREMAELLQPGGCAAVAVPNEHGLGCVCPLDPHQWPPHHVTRWRLQDLKELGRRVNLTVLATGTEHVEGATLKHFWLLHNKLAAALGRKPYWGGTFLPKAVGKFFRVTGLDHYSPRRGTSIYALYQNPAQA